MNSIAEKAHRSAGATGILLLNLGTPEAPTAQAIRRYLRQFLSDRRVIDLPPALWWLILNSFVLPLRPRRLAPAYASIWTQDGSPLLVETQRIGRGVEAQLREQFGDAINVAIAMRYGKPSIKSALDGLTEINARRILILPLFPQYSSASTASAFDGVWEWMSSARWVPAVRTIDSYFDDPLYIEALANSIESYWRDKGRADHLLFSFHGMPQRYLLSGDPYYCHCQKTARLVAERLKLTQSTWSVAFQSRFGREPWVEPFTDQWLPELSRLGIVKVDAVCPGFAADCLETLEEVALRYRALFKSCGGTLNYIPALNAGPDHIRALSSLIAQHLDGFRPEVPTAETIAARVMRAERSEPSFVGKGGTAS